MALKKVPTQDQKLLCASFYLNSFKRVIEELVYNSLDAESSSIAIRVCIEDFFIQVLDNGGGITKDNFRLLGEKYVTSKFTDEISLKSRKNYGFKGISLASIIEISQYVKISSKCQNSQETWMKKFSEGNAEEFSLTTLRPSKGTTVEISGFLYNLCIQQKSLDVFNELNSIKLALEQLSLVHCNISLSLRDDSRNSIIFKIHSNRNIYRTLWSLFKLSTNDIKELQVQKKQYKAEAYIGTNYLASNKYQWIYLNGRIVFKTILHKKFNDTLIKKLSIKINNKQKEKMNENYFNCKIPFYFIFITCPNFDFDINYNYKQTYVEFKNCEEVYKLIGMLVNFYCGDINLKPNGREYNNDISKKGQKILEKVINKNKTKANNIIQLQNGIKGKNIKRNIKKKEINNNHENILKKISNYNYSNKIDQSIKVIETCKPKTMSQKYMDNVLKKFKHVNKNRNLPKSNKGNQRGRKIVETIHKQHVSHELLIKTFKDPTEIVRKRCETLSYEVQNLMCRKYFNNIEIHETDKVKNINFKSNEMAVFPMAPNNIVLKHSKDIAENILNPKQDNNVKEYSCIKQLKTSYDLLKSSDNRETLDINICSKNKSIDIKKNSQSCENLFLNLTFNSHKRTAALKTNLPIQFSNKKSHKNLHPLKPILHKNICKRNQSNKKTNRNKMLGPPILKACNNKSISVINLNYDCGKNVISQDNLNCTSYKSHTGTNDIDNNFENGFRYISNSSYVNDGLNKTYSIIRLSNLSYTNHTLKTIHPKYNAVNCKDFRKNKIDKLITISKSQKSEKIGEPLVICEAILDCNELRDFEQEFDKSFLDNEKKDANNSFNDEISKKSQYSCDAREIDVLKENDKTEQLLLNIVQSEEPNIEIIKNFTEDNIHNLLQIFGSEIINSNAFKITSRHSFIPKGMSQICNSKFPKNTSTYNVDEEYYENAIYKHFADDVYDKFKIFEPDVKNVKDFVPRDLIRANHKIAKDSADLIFNSESLKHATVLGQIDHKFIAARIKNKCSETGKSTEFLTLFDQHAVDERVRLERNLSEYFDGLEWKSVPLEVIKVKLSKEEYFYLYTYKEKFSRFGLQWTFVDKDVLIHAIPKAILGKNPRKTEVVFVAVKRFISEQVEIIKSLRGNISLYPKSIMELVFSEACRYAIKFGDQLSKNDCVNMIGALAGCRTPFQCAHGRPVMAIILELPNNNRTYKINLNNIKKLKNSFL